jgi:hypothetical protein
VAIVRYGNSNITHSGLRWECCSGCHSSSDANCRWHRCYQSPHLQHQSQSRRQQTVSSEGQGREGNRQWQCRRDYTAGAPVWTGCDEHDVLRQAAWLFWRDTRHRKDILDADDCPACAGHVPDYHRHRHASWQGGSAPGPVVLSTGCGPCRRST